MAKKVSIVAEFDVDDNEDFVMEGDKAWITAGQFSVLIEHGEVRGVDDPKQDWITVHIYRHGDEDQEYLAKCGVELPSVEEG
jgi:hypothetical protein